MVVAVATVVGVGVDPPAVTIWSGCKVGVGVIVRMGVGIPLTSDAPPPKEHPAMLIRTSKEQIVMLWLNASLPLNPDILHLRGRIRARGAVALPAHMLHGEATAAVDQKEQQTWQMYRKNF